MRGAGTAGLLVACGSGISSDPGPVEGSEETGSSAPAAPEPDASPTDRASGEAPGPGGEVSALAFPSTGILDDFGDPASLEQNWITQDAGYWISDGELHCEACAMPVLYDQIYGARQEVYATVRSVGSDAIEYNLVLRAQDQICNQIEALYDPELGKIYVAYCLNDLWTNSLSVAIELEPGDQFGARIDVDNRVDVFKNGKVVLTRTLDSFPYDEGRIGLSGIQSAGVNAYDDFGGGEWVEP